MAIHRQHTEMEIRMTSKNMADEKHSAEWKLKLLLDTFNL